MVCINMRDLNERTELLDYLKHKGIGSAFHYVSLHSSPRAKSAVFLSERTDIQPIRQSVYCGCLCIKT